MWVWELRDFFLPFNFCFKILKKVVSEAANPIWSPKPDVLYRIPKFTYTRSKLDILSAPQTNTRLYVVLASLTLCSWFWWWCVSISVSPPRPQGGMVMNWLCCLFNFRSGSSLRETLIISRLSVYPGKWRSRTLKVSILVSAFVAGVLEFSKGLGCVRDQLIGFFRRFCCTGKQNGLGTSQTKI